MNLGDVLAIIAIVVAVIAIIVGAWAVRRWGNQRRRVLFTNESARLLPDLPFAVNGPLKVTFRGNAVDDPHLLRLRLHNVGPADVKSTDFDAGRQIAIGVNCYIYGIVSVDREGYTKISAPGGPGLIEISPLLLKRNEAWEAVVIVSGEPNVQAEFPLADVDVLDKQTFDAELARSILFRILEVSLVAVPLIGGVAGVALSEIVSSRFNDQ